MRDGFEWGAPGARTCGAHAEDITTGEMFSCLLRPNHREPEHHWRQEQGGVIRSVFWVEGGSNTTFVGRELG